MNKKQIQNRLPGWIGAGLAIVITAVWTYWSIGEMYHEGWYGAWTNRLLYLIPGAACLALTLLALHWPRVGGWVIVVIGGAFTVMYMDPKIVDGRLAFSRELAGFLLSGTLILFGALFIVEGTLKRRRQTAGEKPHPNWWLRNLGYLLAVGLPATIAIGASAVMLPIVLTRVDDGDRSARLIQGNDVTLIWAPEGPGWNWQQPWGGYPSWQKVALYGVEPIGFDNKTGYGKQETGGYIYASAGEMAETNLCRYLDADGLILMDSPQDVWRMPTVDELVRSLPHHGENAGCTWQGEFKTQVSCERRPDKESPLWSTDLSPVYYWAADEYDERGGYFVSYNGFVNAATKNGGNPRHSYRCVREP